MLAATAVAWGGASAAAVLRPAVEPGAAIVVRERGITRLEMRHPDGGRSVLLALRWNDAGFALEAAVPDSPPRDGQRSWRYGDGLVVNFVLPGPEASAGASDRFATFGFSLEHGEPVGVLVNRNGVSLLAHRSELTPVIVYDAKARVIRYKVAIPWPMLAPFTPLLDHRAGLNVVVVDRDADGARRVTSLVADPDYDSETRSERRFVPLVFEPAPDCAFRFEAEIDDRVVTGRDVTVTVGTCAAERRRVRLDVSVRDAAGVTTARKDVETVAGPGLRREQVTLRLPRGRRGAHVVEVSAGGTASWREEMIALPDALWDRLERRVDSARERARDPLAAASADTLRYHLDALRAAVARALPRDDPAPLVRRLDTLESLLSRFERDGSLFLTSGYLLAAHRSSLDGTLQPFSMVLPEGFDPERPVPLVLVLHGSGTDEVGAVQAVAEQVPRGVLVVGPRGRDLSSWYTGSAETEVLDVLGRVRRLFPVTSAFVQGFSMGGYGAWRMAFLHPDLFDGAVVVAGTPVNLRRPTPTDDMRNRVGEARDMPFLVIHGDADPAVDIAATDAFVARLTAAGYDVEYRRVAGGGHGDFDTGTIVRQWLERRLAGAAVPAATQ